MEYSDDLDLEDFTPELDIYAGAESTVKSSKSSLKRARLLTEKRRRAEEFLEAQRLEKKFGIMGWDELLH